jgi:GNAT superfamily N-acetyltransferase
LQRALVCLSDESTRARFLAPKDQFSRRELTYLTELDGHDHVAFVAVELRHPTRIVAVARYIRDPEAPDSAEAAITVADHLQGRGLGRAMGEVLADAARSEGIARFTASMLSDNDAALRLFHAISERLVTEPLDGPVREIVAELAA